VAELDNARVLKPHVDAAALAMSQLRASPRDVAEAVLTATDSKTRWVIVATRRDYSGVFCFGAYASYDAAAKAVEKIPGFEELRAGVFPLIPAPKPDKKKKSDAGKSGLDILQDTLDARKREAATRGRH